MPDEHINRFEELGRQDVGRDARVDRRWVKQRAGMERADAAVEVVLSFLGHVGPDTYVSEDAVKGVVRAMFEEGGEGGRMRDDVTTRPVEAHELVDRSPLDAGIGVRVRDPDRRLAIEELLDRRDLTEVLGRPDLDDLLDRVVPGFPPDPFGPRPGIGELGRLDEFIDSGCIRDVISGLSKLGGVVASVQRARPKAGAVIRSIAPRRAVVGQPLTITGSGFGDPKGSDVEVYIGRTHAPHTSWSDTEIVVTVPGGLAGDACVSVLENVALDSAAAGEAVVLAVEVGSVMTGCFGISRVGERLASGTVALLEPEAQCEPDHDNHIWVGIPAIDSFLVNGSSMRATVQPTVPLELTWATRFADSVQLEAVTVSGVPPTTVMSGSTPVAANGVRRLGPSGTRPVWEVDYVITATNAAGSLRKSVRAVGVFGTALAFLGAGTRSIFHAGALEYLPVAVPTAPRAVSSTGLGAFAALSAATAYGNPTPLIDSWRTISAAPIPAPPQNARAYNVVRSLIDTDPAVAGAFAAYEQGMYVRLLNAVDVAINEAMMSYADAPAVGEIQIAITDDEAILEGKVMDGLLEAGMWVASNVVGPSLEAGGAADSEMGKSAKVAKAAVEEAIVGDAVQGGIGAVAKGLSYWNAGVAVVFVVMANVVKALVEGSFDIQKANALRAALAARGLCSRAPLTAFIDDFISRSGLQGRTVGTSTGVALAASVLESGEPCYVDGFATARTAAGGTVAPLGWRDGLLAVTAVPGAMAPVSVGPFTMVDASSTDTGPIEILQRSDVDEIVVVHATCNLLPRLAPPDNFGTAGFLSLARRSERVRSATLALTGVEPDLFWRGLPGRTGGGGRRWTTRHVMPTIALSHLYAFEHEPGLLSIWRDYGYMRAFDVMAPTLVHPGEDEASEQLRRDLRDRLARLSDLITGTREQAWSLECSINKVAAAALGPLDRRNPPQVSIVNDGADLLALRQLKSLIASLVTRRLQAVQLTEKVYRSGASRWPGDAVPRSRFASWFTEFEEHGYRFDNIQSIDPTGAGRVTPWLETNGFTVNDGVPAAAAPSVAAALFGPLP